MKSESKKKGWFKVCPEKWIFGSTREEMTSAERGVWIDFLALAYMNDPPGQIDFFTYRRLANQLNIRLNLLNSTINKALLYEKVELKEPKPEPKTNKKDDKSDPISAQHAPKRGPSCQIDHTTKVPARTIIILKWSEYQSEYLRQKPYRQRKSTEEEKIEDEENQGERLQDFNAESVTQVTDRGEERRRDKRRGEETNINSNELESSLPSNSKPFSKGKNNLLQEYLSRLRDCPGYPFDDYLDTSLFYHVNGEYPNINILGQLDKKITWWKDRPDALKPGANPRNKLAEWFETEHEFQNRRG